MVLALLAAFFVALLSLVGVFFFGNNATLRHRLTYALPLSVGAFLSVVFFELIPEALHESEFGSIAIAAGFLGFYFISIYLNEYHHHHDSEHELKTAHGNGRMVLMGDAVHNIADGMVVAVAFSISTPLGIATTLGILLHEVPQEIAEFAVLRAAGYSTKRALVLNFLSASSVIIGVLIASSSLHFISSSLGILLGIAAGNLLFIAASDLLPTLTEQRESRGTTFMLVLLGMVGIAFLLSYSHERFGEKSHSDSALVFQEEFADLEVH